MSEQRYQPRLISEMPFCGHPIPVIRNVFILAGAAWAGLDIYLATENIVNPWAIVASLFCFAVAVAFQWVIKHRDNETLAIRESLAARANNYSYGLNSE